MENKTKIIITRSSEWMNRLRSYTILIDKTDAGSVKNASSEEFIVAPGEHKVQCKLSWFYSPEFNINLKQDEVAYLKVKSALRFYLPLILLFVVGLLFNLYYKDNPNNRPLWVHWFGIFSFVPYVVYILYYSTAGRKKYLIVEEDKNNVFAS